MAGNILRNYPASVSLTVTNLHSLASSQDGLSGWGSAAISNASDNWDDFLVGINLVTASANRQSTGFINIYVVPALDDTPTFPAVASGTLGTEGAIAFTSNAARDSIAVLLDQILVNNSTNGAIFAKLCSGIADRFGGNVPRNFVIFISQNVTTTTTAGLAASGNTVTLNPQHSRYT